MPAALLVS